MLTGLFMSGNLEKIAESLSSFRSFTRLIAGRKENGAENVLEQDDDTGKSNKPSSSVEELFGQNISCPICLDDISLNEMAMKCPENNHFFHKKCLSEWLVYQMNPFEGRRFDQTRRACTGTCPICRSELTTSAAKLEVYLRNPSYKKDDRFFAEKLKFKLRMYGMLFFADRKTFFRSFAGLFVFTFGLFKGFTLKTWTFTQDVVYFTLPHRLRLVTTIGYIFGLLLRACYFLYETIEQKRLI